MYFLRGAVVSLGVYFLIYVALSVIVVCCGRVVRSRRIALNAGRLYGIRVLPLAGAVGIVGLFSVPSFLYLEPYVTDERIGLLGISIAIGGGMFISLGLASVLSAWWKTSRFLASCKGISERMEIEPGAPAFEVTGAGPALLVAGIFRPRILISRGAGELLDAPEMQVAIRHELAHVRRRDNLKKLVLRFCSFPFMAKLEREWLHAAELAADDAAVNDEHAALDLASALIKMTRQRPRMLTPELAMSLVPHEGTLLTGRIERLLRWQRHVQTPTPHFRILMVGVALAVLIVGFHYGSILQRMHEVTELLMR
jgi:hypothetical protein